mmetsp:Transcript_8487/g.21084  ORF Transcript_8487/g.21084 Transcript_8487/m.21084 type:complete len:363 (+) Transcript_8487:276-1364(+)
MSGCVGAARGPPSPTLTSSRGGRRRWHHARRRVGVGVVELLAARVGRRRGELPRLLELRRRLQLAGRRRRRGQRLELRHLRHLQHLAVAGGRRVLHRLLGVLHLRVGVVVLHGLRCELHRLLGVLLGRRVAVLPRGRVLVLPRGGVAVLRRRRAVARGAVVGRRHDLVDHREHLLHLVVSAPDGDGAVLGAGYLVVAHTHARARLIADLADLRAARPDDAPHHDRVHDVHVPRALLERVGAVRVGRGVMAGGHDLLAGRGGGGLVAVLLDVQRELGHHLEQRHVHVGQLAVEGDAAVVRDLARLGDRLGAARLVHLDHRPRLLADLRDDGAGLADDRAARVGAHEHAHLVPRRVAHRRVGRA